jgi:hypothetical protein
MGYLMSLGEDGNLYYLDTDTVPGTPHMWKLSKIPNLPGQKCVDKTKSKVSCKHVSAESHKFHEFWDAFAYKNGKVLAEKAWSKLTDAEKKACMASVPRYVEETYLPKAGKFPTRCMASTYLNQRRWEDEESLSEATDVTADNLETWE